MLGTRLTILNRSLRNMLADPVRGLQISLLLLLALVMHWAAWATLLIEHMSRWMRST